MEFINSRACLYHISITVCTVLSILSWLSFFVWYHHEKESPSHQTNQPTNQPKKKACTGLENKLYKIYEALHLTSCINTHFMVMLLILCIGWFTFFFQFIFVVFVSVLQYLLLSILVCEVWCCSLPYRTMLTFASTHYSAMNCHMLWYTARVTVY